MKNLVDAEGPDIIDEFKLANKVFNTKATDLDSLIRKRNDTETQQGIT